jgi:hypothetical protein
MRAFFTTRDFPRILGRVRGRLRPGGDRPGSGRFPSMLKPALLLLVALLAVPLRAEAPPLLQEALTKVARDKGRWAYTESDQMKNGQDKVVDTTVLRFDPSKPYAEQYSPVEVHGHAPTKADLEKYRQRGIQRGRGLEKAEEQGKPAPGRTLGDVIDLAHATVSSEDAATVTYEVPLRADNNERFPPDKFQVLIRVNKAQRALEHVAVHLRAPIRYALVLKVKSGEVEVDFAQVDPKHNPAMTSVKGGGAVSIFFVPVARSGEMIRSDFKHVRPYDERFNVEIGPTKALDF